MATPSDIATAITSQLAADSLPPLNSDLAKNALLTRLVDLSVLQVTAIQNMQENINSNMLVARYISVR